MIVRMTGIALSALLLTASATSASVIDPCRQAYEREKVAENRFWRWCNNHTEGGGGGWTGSCSVEGRGEVLYDEWQRAMDARRNACT
jgi:hypothetical protein